MLLILSFQSTYIDKSTVICIYTRDFASLTINSVWSYTHVLTHVKYSLGVG